MLWDPLIVNGEPLGEDFSFCYRWTQIGGKIYVDPNIDMGITDAVFTEEISSPMSS